jgi:hypothetical protein
MEVVMIGKQRKAKSGKTASRNHCAPRVKNKNQKNEPAFISDDLAEGSREEVEKSLEHTH